MTTICHPHCKINIGLNIVSKRADGYHNLETIFYPVGLCDELITEEAEEDSLCIEGVQLDGDWHDNLVMKVLRKLRELGHAVPPQRIRLVKNIPFGAGLGGGSSDAAFMLKMLNERYCLGLTEEQMEEFLSPLGADCPFFIKGKPVLAEGIGNIFTHTDLSLSGWHIVLVKPDDYISTKEAYAGVTPAPPSFALSGIDALTVDQWEGRVTNDFEASVFPTHPAVASIKAKFYEIGARYAAMSGSGSCVFGLFREPREHIATTFPACFTFQTVLE